MEQFEDLIKGCSGHSVETASDPRTQARALVLLRAAYDILTRCEEAPVVLEAATVTAHYDEADCDGMCLREEIAELLRLPEAEHTNPIVLDEE